MWFCTLLLLQDILFHKYSTAGNASKQIHMPYVACGAVASLLSTPLQNTGTRTRPDAWSLRGASPSWTAARSCRFRVLPRGPFKRRYNNTGCQDGLRKLVKKYQTRHLLLRGAPCVRKPRNVLYQRKLCVHFDGLGVLVQGGEVAVVNRHVDMLTAPACREGLVLVHMVLHVARPTRPGGASMHSSTSN